MCKTPANTDAVFLGSVKGERRHSKPWHTNLNLRRKKFNFKIDTGADVTFMSQASYQSLGAKLMSSTIKMKSASGPLTCLGYFNAQVKRSGKQHQLQVYVVEGLEVNLLGRADAVQLQLIRRLDTVKVDPVGKLDCSPVKIPSKKMPNHTVFTLSTSGTASPACSEKRAGTNAQRRCHREGDRTLRVVCTAGAGGEKQRKKGT